MIGPSEAIVSLPVHGVFESLPDAISESCRTEGEGKEGDIEEREEGSEMRRHEIRARTSSPPSGLQAANSEAFLVEKHSRPSNTTPQDRLWRDSNCYVKEIR